jgi:hypothetical protein
MNLKSFEIEVERKTVERGLDYYRSGDVKKLEKGRRKRVQRNGFRQ